MADGLDESTHVYKSCGRDGVAPAGRHRHTHAHPHAQAHRQADTRGHTQYNQAHVSCIFLVYVPLGIAHAASKGVRLGLEGLLATGGSGEERHAGGLTTSHSRPGYLYKPVCVLCTCGALEKQAGREVRQRVRVRVPVRGEGRRDGGMQASSSGATRGRKTKPCTQ
jgi:hypothetical protein